MALGTLGAIIAGSLGSAAIGAFGNKKAGKRRVRGINKGITEQRDTFSDISDLFGPGRDVGNQALNTFASAFIPGFEGIAGLDPIAAEELSAIFRNLPGTQFQINEAERAVGNSFASRGGAFGGNAIRELGERTAGIAADRTFGGLERLLGLGERATFNTAGARGTSGVNISNLFVRRGEAKAKGVEGVTSALQGGLNNFLLSMKT